MLKSLLPMSFTFERILKHIKKQEHQPHHPIYDTLLSWTIAFLCFVYYGFRYTLMKYQQYQSNTSSPNHRWLIPLTTNSRTELDRHTLAERLQQLQLYLSNQVVKKRQATNECDNNESNHVWLDEDLILLIRSQDVPRRLASLIIVLWQKDRTEEPPGLQDDWQVSLLEQLVRIWPALLPLPPTLSLAGEVALPSNFTIALILPAYRERGSKIQRVLNKALMACHSPHEVQVIVVDAGENIGLNDAFLPCQQQQQQQQQQQKEKLQQQPAPSQSTTWGQTEKLTFSEGGGRGPCLNYGARHAKAQIYTFLHSDTTLPHHWDKAVREALLPQQRDGHRPVNHASAFSFGIDTTPDGLDGGCYPYGIQSIQSFLGNLRARVFKLPYGDHVISIASSIFWYVGGYPDQPIMEDYELMHLLRQRASLLYRDEQLAILPSRGYCSPRRWQRYGVPYVTLANAYCVYQYECGMTPDDLFRYYYNQDSQKRKSEKSPWELEMMEQARAATTHSSVHSV